MHVFRVVVFALLLLNHLPAVADDDFEANLLQTKRIIGSIQTGQDFLYATGTHNNGIVLVLGTVSSRTKYFVITPVEKLKNNNIYINCSYIRSVDNPTGTVSVGRYCSGLTLFTMDSFDNVVSEKNTVSYSSAHSWLRKAKKVTSCARPLGMTYANYYIVRCQDGDEDESTENVKIAILSKDFRKIFSIDGYEFVPTKSLSQDNKAFFWGLKKESTPEIIQREIPAISTGNEYEFTTEIEPWDLDKFAKLEREPHCVTSAGWFWTKYPANPINLDIPANEDDFIYCTRIVNGAWNGYNDRLTKFNKIIEILGMSQHLIKNIAGKYLFRESRCWDNARDSYMWARYHDSDSNFQGCTKDPVKALEAYRRFIEIYNRLTEEKPLWLSKAQDRIAQLGG